MAVTKVSLYKTAVSVVQTGGKPVTAMFGPVAGGIITNPPTPVGQGITTLEPLWIDIVNPATLGKNGTSFALQAGQTYTVVPGQTTSVSITAATTGHRFSGVVYQPSTPYPPAPQPGTFPPSVPDTLTQIIPSYLYEEYADDDDLQSFVAAYNGIAQGYLTWFATIGLPVYTSAQIADGLLDFVAENIYGMLRPVLASGRNRDVGPLNTYGFNTLALNRRKTVGPNNITATSDDVFKRIITWNFYKGDGMTFNARWLKRRIMRFLTGPNGTAPNIDSTYLVSVTFGPGIVSIRITVGTRRITGGALYNVAGFNRQAYNALQSIFVPGPNPLPLEPVLKEAIESGVLTHPFQYQFAISI